MSVKPYMVACKKCGTEFPQKDRRPRECLDCKAGDYGKSFLKARKQAIKRDGGCAICSTSDRLQVHHLDHNIKNNDLSNLVTMCIHCHQSTHRKKHAEIIGIRRGMFGTRLIYKDSPSTYTKTGSKMEVVANRKYLSSSASRSFYQTIEPLKK